MTSFLQHVADDIITKWGSDLSNLTVVFPNKRASLFLSQELARKAGRPVWSPSYITISQLFRRQSPLEVADQLQLVCLLHKCFVRITGSNETLDHFWSWGQLLLADFDDLDKNMADAQMVFRNVDELHDLTDDRHLTERQIEILKKFFDTFSVEGESQLRKRFVQLWNNLYSIYSDFRQELRSLGIAYEGMLYRDVAENLKADDDESKILFVGFNMLQKVEVALFDHLKAEGRAHFYWDFDEYYTADRNQEAGTYIREWLSRYPTELALPGEAYCNLSSKDKDITYIAAKTETAQAYYVASWLREKERISDGNRTAIVMCDENMLPTIIHTLPTEVPAVNITTGFPLAQTNIAAILREKMRGTRLKDTDAIIAMLKECIQQETDIYRASAQASPLVQESLFRAWQIVSRLEDLHAEGYLPIDASTLGRLVSQIIGQTSIPFHGEPAEGIQLMGVLETRNLDFDHLLILSCNEGNMPKGVNDASFIPYSIRDCWQLTTIDNKVAIFAYYFMRLLQRCNDITIMYNDSTGDSGVKEMSRFMLQLLVESGHDIKRKRLSVGSDPVTDPVKEVIKTPEMMQQYISRKKPISPSSINRWRRCPLQFYFQDVAGIYAKDEEIVEGVVNQRTFGQVFHKAAEITYNELTQRSLQSGRSGMITNVAIDGLLSGKRELLWSIIDRAFAEIFLGENASNRTLNMNGLQLISRRVVMDYMERLLKVDRRHAPFRVYGNEIKSYTDFEVIVDGKPITVKSGGYIDRLDIATINGKESFRVIDYKTGGGEIAKFDSVEAVFDLESKKEHADYMTQAMLYSLAVKRDTLINPKALPVSPALVFVQKASADDYDPTLMINEDPIHDIGEHAEAFSTCISGVLQQMLGTDPDKGGTATFSPTPNDRSCRFCHFTQLCARVK